MLVTVSPDTRLQHCKHPRLTSFVALRRGAAVMVVTLWYR